MFVLLFSTRLFNCSLQLFPLSSAAFAGWRLKMKTSSIPRFPLWAHLQPVGRGAIRRFRAERRRVHQSATLCRAVPLCVCVCVGAGNAQQECHFRLDTPSRPLQLVQFDARAEICRHDQHVLKFHFFAAIPPWRTCGLAPRTRFEPSEQRALRLLAVLPSAPPSKQIAFFFFFFY